MNNRIIRENDAAKKAAKAAAQPGSSSKNESRMLSKRLIRMTESDLHRIVKESVKRILKENKKLMREFNDDWDDEYDDWDDGYNDPIHDCPYSYDEIMNDPELQREYPEAYDYFLGRDSQGSYNGWNEY